ncbi:MAG: alkaline phosphatase family protein [Chromatiaceae bacterium]|nr:alkaline phosphatase family protein [Chromatiaceae bacterium]
MPNTVALPLVWAGPILRRVLRDRVSLWLAVREPVRVRLELAWEPQPQLESLLEPDDRQPSAQTYILEPGDPSCRLQRAGSALYYVLIDLRLTQPLPAEHWIAYSLALQPLAEPEQPWQDSAAWAPDLCYPGQSSPGFKVPAQVHSLLHGSCRKPHHPGGDGLARADQLLADLLAGSPSPTTPNQATASAQDADTMPAWPSLLMLSGDQVYMDDVAGPMLRAIHALIERLGLPDESLPELTQSGVVDARSLYAHRDGYYRRERLLPRQRHSAALLEVLFGGVEKPIFTSANAHNHLITLGEMLAMYLLVFSPAPWQGLDLDPPASLTKAQRVQFAQERATLDAFIAALPAVRRLLAHLPVAMIFDDHDVTDDWNLSRAWEEVAYGHALSRRVIGNALIGYLIHQGWGNRPEAFSDDLLAGLQRSLDDPGSAEHEACVQRLLRFGDWHYDWPTTPPLVVIDSRTHRWRSESAASKPSGLLDWEALTDLQQRLRGLPAVLLVSPAPIFGVKLIESIQRVFTWLGYPLMVDAENWMAHPGAAHTLLNIFRHPQTPEHFVILSGDVHYSFVYDVELRGRSQGPEVWQITSSGVRNAFPERLLAVLDRLDHGLFAPGSPLNVFTRRRRLRILPRKPEGTASGRRLLNGSGIGLVELDADGRPWRIRELLADGPAVIFAR